MKSTFRGRTRRSNRSPAGTVVLFILVNLILGMTSQPIIALIAEGLHHFA